MYTLEKLFSEALQWDSFIVVTVVETSGSTPRELGAYMAVSSHSLLGSIGGGNLEYQAIKRAREMLAKENSELREDHFFGLGIAMSQCCGGAVRLLFERYSNEFAVKVHQSLRNPKRSQMMYFANPIKVEGSWKPVVLRDQSSWKEVPDFLSRAQDVLSRSAEPMCTLVNCGSDEWFVSRVDYRPTKIVLFGAGHVGKALVKLLQDLPFQIDWVDQRLDMFPQEIPKNTVPLHLENPLERIKKAESDTFYVVMTHSHGQDYEICLRILKDRNFAWLGLIGSETKRQRFEKRFVADGIDSFTLKRLNCPIGLSSIRGKFPAVIAMSVASQLLEAHQVISNRKIQLPRSFAKRLESSTRRRV